MLLRARVLAINDQCLDSLWRLCERRAAHEGRDGDGKQCQKFLGGRMDHGNSYRSPCEPVMYPPGPAVSNASSFIRRDFAPRLLAAPRLQPLQHQVFPAASAVQPQPVAPSRSAAHTSELQSLMRTPYAVFCLKTKTIRTYGFNR